MTLPAQASASVRERGIPGALGCVWIMLLVLGPLALLAALAVLVETENLTVALVLLAAALACGLGAAIVTRIGQARPVPRLTGAEGVTALARTSRGLIGHGVGLPAIHAPFGPTATLATAMVVRTDTLEQGVGILADDPNVTVAWVQNGALLPRIDLIAPGVDAAFEEGLGGVAQPIDHPDLIGPWRARVHGDDGVGAVLGPEMRAFLNSLDQTPLVIRFDGPYVAVLVPGGDVPTDVQVALGRAMTARFALPSRLVVRADGTPVYDPVVAARRERTAQRDASIGAVSTRSRVRGAWLGLEIAFTFLLLFSFGTLVTAAARGASEGVIETLIVLVAVGGLGLGVSIAADVRLVRRQRRIAHEIRAAATATGLRYRLRYPALESAWVRRPFASLRFVQVSPGAIGTHAGRPAGIAYLEGDAGVKALSTRTFTSRIAWVDTGRQLPAVDFVREGFAQRAAELVGGTDVDVESYEFNRAWRVRADQPRAVHAMLQPVMIALLVDLADAGLAIHTDGTTVVVWDDGRAGEVDMAHRLEIAASFADTIPGFVGDPGAASG